MGARQDSPRIRLRGRGQVRTASAFRVNPARTIATMGGLDLGDPLANVCSLYDRSRAIHQKQWDVRLFDVETRTHLAVPGGINTTSKREGRPSVSGDYLLFERGPQRWGAGTKIVLYRF